MQVYIELALLENFCMDFTLLWAAKAACKNPATYFRIALGAAAGAGVAAVFPLLPVPPVWATVLKAVSGLALCLIAGKFSGIKTYVKFTGLFFAFCAVLGGALIALFSLAGTDYAQGSGYTLSSVPVGIPLFCALVAVIAAKKIAGRFSKREKSTVKCRIFAGQSSVEITGFYDSGNKVYLHGAPVSVVPESVIKKLNPVRINDRVKIHTVAGSAEMRVFTADRLEIESGGKKAVIKGAYMGLNPNGGNVAVLHPDILEV